MHRKDLFLHIGWPKTGTTALQSFCHANRAALAAQGLAYYTTRAESAGSIARAIAKAEPMAPHSARLQDWAARQDAAKVLISSEGFAGTDLTALADFLAPEQWRRITVIAYLRPQDEYLESWYKQVIKWGNKVPLQTYLGAQNPVWRLADYDGQMARWQAWCAGLPDARLQAAIFDRQTLAGGDIGTDVFARLGLPGPGQPLGGSNVSPSAALIALYLKLPPIERLQQINRAMMASGHPATVGSRDILTPDQRAAIMARFAPGNERLRARLFPDRDTLFAPKPPPPAAPEDATDTLKTLLIATLERLRGPDIVAQARTALA